MSLSPGCPRCPTPVAEDQDAWRCPDHGPVQPLWRATKVGYEDFADYLQRSAAMPSLLRWPLAPGWAVTDFGCVGGAVPGAGSPPGAASTGVRACFMSSSGMTDLDGVVELTVVSEEPGVGLGARCAGASRTDPGADIGDGPPQARVRVDGRPVPLWSVSTSRSDVAFDRSVFAGEAQGRWLWLVLRPASAALLLGDEWVLEDVASLGPELMDLPFRDGPPAW